MNDFEKLKQTIDTYIRVNGKGYISSTALNSILKAMVDTLGAATGKTLLITLDGNELTNVPSADTYGNMMFIFEDSTTGEMHRWITIKYAGSDTYAWKDLGITEEQIGEAHGGGFYNLDNEHPLQTGYYTLAMAVEVVANDATISDEEKNGMIIQFYDGETWKFCFFPTPYQWTTPSAFADPDNWKVFVDPYQAESDHQRAETDHLRATGDHSTAAADHTQAGTDHSTAVADHTQAGNDHTTAAADHSTAVADHNQAAADHTQAGQDHSQATADHNQAVADSVRADNDHVQAVDDHTRAESDHSTAASDHTQAGNDHTRAESDHTTASADHTQAGTDHTAAQQATAAANTAAGNANTKASEANVAARAAEQATVGAGRVNAYLLDYELYVTDRNGHTVNKNVKGDKGDGIDYTTLTDAQKQELAAAVVRQVTAQNILGPTYDAAHRQIIFPLSSGVRYDQTNRQIIFN